MSADDELYFTFDLGENNSINADFDLEENNSIDANFNIYAAGTTWGSITGNLEEQTDLSDILNTFNGQITSNHNEITSLSNTIQTYGDIVTYDAADFATSNQGVLASTALQPGDNITRLTNNARYITASALNGYATEAWVNNKGYITGITSNDVTNALGYTPYNNTNPRGFITRADLPTLEDLTTTVQLNAINSGATTTLINQITTNKNAITSETTNRQNADNNLQSQIDAITAASDVTDIVGTYAQLQAYDTSSLPPNSIIKVLQDESRNNETTYYRWVITGGVGSWVLIGEEGPYYTKSESDSIFVPQTRTINGQSLSNNITLAIPTDTSELTNGAGYITDSALNGYATQNWVGQQGYLTTITSSDVTNALGYTPYNSSNPNGYTSNVGTVTSVNNAQPDNNGNVTINIPTVNNPTITFTQGGATKGTITLNQSSNQTIALDAGGSTYTAGNGIDITNDTISIDTSVVATQTWVGQQGYLTAITSSDVTNALGYTPVNQSLSNLDLAGQYLFDVKMDTDYSNADYEPVNQSLSNLDSEGQDKFDVKIDLDYSNANYKPANQQLSNLNSTGQAKFDAKVNKSGDTMTGALNYMKTDVTKGTNPSVIKYWEWRNLDNNQNPAEWHTNRMGAFQTALYPDGTVETLIKAFRNDPTVSTSADIKVSITSSGVKSCEFPNTTCCDGAFVSSAKDLSSIKTTGTYTIDLQSYLPSGGAIYEVWLTGSNFTSGSTYSIYKLYTDIMNAQLPVNDTGANYSWITHTGTNSREGCFLIKVPVRRYIYEIIEAANLSDRFVPLTALGYRRIGTNS